MARLTSPNDMQQHAIDTMLGGKPPRSNADWVLCANYWAANIAEGVEEAAMPLLGMVLDCPLSRETLVKIAKFQASRKAR